MDCREDRSEDWAVYPHDADLGVRGLGQTLAEAFANAARALSSAICPLEEIAPSRSVTVECENPDIEILLADFLNAVIYEMATRRMLFRDFHVEIESDRLRATLLGEEVDVARHAPAVEPKGATLTDLKVARTGDKRWLAQCVIDV